MDLNSSASNHYGQINSGSSSGGGSGGGSGSQQLLLHSKVNSVDNVPERNVLIAETEHLLRTLIASEKNYRSCWPYLTFGPLVPKE